MEDFIEQLNKNGQIKDDCFPYWTMEIFLVNNVTLLYSSFDRLRNGYLGISQSLLRPVVESISLSVYFFEFPKDEKKYRKNPKSFYTKLKALNYDGWIEGVLQRIDNEGSKFAKCDLEKGQSWYNFLFKSLGEEACNFLHSNPIYIYSVVYSGQIDSKEQYAYGPNWPKDIVMKNALWKIIESLLLNLIVMDRIFDKYIVKNDINFIKEVVDKLNSWKKEYNEYVPEK